MIDINNHLHITTDTVRETEKVKMVFDYHGMPFFELTPKLLTTDSSFANEVYGLLEDNLLEEDLSWR